MRKTLRCYFFSILFILTILATTLVTAQGGEFTIGTWDGYSEIDLFSDENYSSAYVWGNDSSQGSDGSIDIECDSSKEHGLIMYFYISGSFLNNNPGFQSFNYKFDQNPPSSSSADLYIYNEQGNERATVDIYDADIPFFINSLKNSSTLAFQTTLQGRQFTYVFDVKRFSDVLSKLECYKESADPFADNPVSTDPFADQVKELYINSWFALVDSDPFSDFQNYADLAANNPSNGFTGYLSLTCDKSLQNGINLTVDFQNSSGSEIYDVSSSSRSFDFKFDQNQSDTAYGSLLIETRDAGVATLLKADEMPFFTGKLTSSSTFAFRTTLEGKDLTYEFDIRGFKDVLSALNCYK